MLTHDVLKRRLDKNPKSDFSHKTNTFSYNENAKWGVAREALGKAVGAELTPDTMVSLMLQSEQIWMLFESFVSLVMKTRELDGRA